MASQCCTDREGRVIPPNKLQTAYIFRWTESLKKVLKKGLKKVTELKKVLENVMKLKKVFKKVNSLKKNTQISNELKKELKK